MYRSAEVAYSAMDFSGLGYITVESLLNSIVIRDRVPFSRDQVMMFFKEFNLFPEGEKGIDFDNFKKNFFPHHYLVQDPSDDFDDKVAKVTRDEIMDNGKEHPAIIKKRLLDLE
jgi:hypothetical protein